MIERLQRMPVPALPTFVGALTLSNVYNTMGYPWVRHLTMWAATIILLLYIVREGLIKSTCADWRAWQKILCKRNSTKSRMALRKQGGIWRIIPWRPYAWERAAVCAPQA